MSDGRPILVKLDRAGSHIVYHITNKQAFLHDGLNHLGTPVMTEDLLDLFVNGWIARYDTSDGEHRYRITDAGRKAIG